MKNKKSAGPDGVPATVVKHCIDEICEPITYIINNSLKYGVFPDVLKEAVVKPLHKKGDVNEIANYRPISILSTFSNIFEMVVCKQLTGFFYRYSLFATSQHGYMKGRSTQTAIYDFIKVIIDAFESSEMIVGLFVDLSKAFDSLDHDLICY